MLRYVYAPSPLPPVLPPTPRRRRLHHRQKRSLFNRFPDRPPRRRLFLSSPRPPVHVCKRLGREEGVFSFPRRPSVRPSVVVRAPR